MSYEQYKIHGNPEDIRDYLEETYAKKRANFQIALADKSVGFSFHETGRSETGVNLVITGDVLSIVPEGNYKTSIRRIKSKLENELNIKLEEI